MLVSLPEEFAEGQTIFIYTKTPEKVESFHVSLNDQPQVDFRPESTINTDLQLAFRVPLKKLVVNNFRDGRWQHEMEYPLQYVLGERMVISITNVGKHYRFGIDFKRYIDFPVRAPPALIKYVHVDFKPTDIIVAKCLTHAHVDSDKETLYLVIHNVQRN